MFSFTFDSVLNSSGNLSFEFPTQRKLDEFYDSERDDVTMDNQTIDAEDMDTGSAYSTVLILDYSCF